MSRENAIKGAVLLVVLAGLVTLSWLLPVGEWIEAFTDWVAGRGATGVVLFGVGYVLGTVLLFPGSLLTIAAGIVFGPAWGALIALASATCGATFAFLIGRYVARRPVQRWMAKHKAARALDKAVGARDWKVIALLRLSPLVPFGPSNYFFGVTRARLWAFVLASMAGMAPGAFLYAYLGHVGKATLGGGSSASAAEIAFLIAGLAATAVVSWYLAHVAGKALHKQRGRA
jgi:uncharacterized membrane protein YdjX (TVP38/TMEM64 family)